MTRKLNQIKRRSFWSVVSLLGQSSYSAILGFIAFFILTFKSSVYLLGIYNTVLASISFFSYISNLGLAAAVMQKKDIDTNDLNTAFILQFVLVILASLFGFMLTPLVLKYYKDLPHEAVYLYWSVILSFIFLSLKTIPSVLLEKKIQIYKVVFIQAVENTVFYLVVIFSVLFEKGISGLIAAVIIRSLVGVIGIYILNPWIPRLTFSVSSAKELLSYGLPYQGSSIVALIKDDLLVIYLGGILGFTNLGYVMFGKKYAEFSIRIIMDNINRVAFPIFAQYQKSKIMLSKVLQKVFLYESLFIFPIIIGGIFIFSDVLQVIPGYFDKWHYGLSSFYFFSLSALFVSLYSPIINFFNGIGKVKISLKFMIFFTIMTWVIVPTCIYIFNYLGVSIAFFIMSLFFIFVVYFSYRYVTYSLYRSIKLPFIASLCMTLYLICIKIIVSFMYVQPIYKLALFVIGGAIIYIGVLYFLKGKEILLSMIHPLVIHEK